MDQIKKYMLSDLESLRAQISNQRGTINDLAKEIAELKSRLSVIEDLLKKDESY